MRRAAPQSCPVDDWLQCSLLAVRSGAYHGRVTLLEEAIATAEFLVVDTETNGLAGDACEMT